MQYAYTSNEPPIGGIDHHNGRINGDTSQSDNYVCYFCMKLSELERLIMGEKPVQREV